MTKSLQSHSKMGMVRVISPVIEFRGPFVSLEQAKLGISNLVWRLIMTILM